MVAKWIHEGVKTEKYLLSLRIYFGTEWRKRVRQASPENAEMSRRNASLWSPKTAQKHLKMAYIQKQT